MAIALLNELQDRLHVAVTAGVAVIEEDFRLRRAVEQFQPLAASAPVLAKLLQQVQTLLDPKCPDPSAALLEAVTLADAVVCTQADSTVTEEAACFETIPGTDGPQCRYSGLEPLLTALTTKGSGRYEVVRQAKESRLEALSDFRLKSALVAALGDSYSEMADQVQDILEEQGLSVLPLLKEGFDGADEHKSSEMVRRLKIIGALAKKAENGFYLSLLDNSCPVVRAESIRALRFAGENTAKLKELSVTERGNPKKAALYTLGRMDTPEADAYWVEALGKASAKAEQYLRFSASNLISDALAKRLDQLIDGLLKVPDNTVIGKADREQLTDLVMALPNKTSPAMLDVLARMADNQKHLLSLKGEDKAALLVENRLPGARDGHENLFTAICQRLVAGMADTMEPRTFDGIKALCGRTGAAYLSAGFIAWMLTDPAHSYDALEAWIHDTRGAEALIHGFLHLSVADGRYILQYLAEQEDETRWTRRIVCKTLDLRWFKALTGKKANLFTAFLKENLICNRSEGVLSRLVNPEDPDSFPVLQEYFYRRAAQGHDSGCLYALKTCGWTDFKGLIPKYLSNQKRFSYSEMVNLYRSLPLQLEDQLAELEQIASMIEKGSIHSQYKSEHDRVRAAATKLRENPENGVTY